MTGQLVNTEAANVKDGEFRFVVKVSQAQRHDRPELASGNAAE